jgi:ribosomal protein S18 acetylase RimI-like enzyme
MLTVRRFREADAPMVWALNDLPNIGATADPTVPLPLPPAPWPPAAFPDLADIPGGYLRGGGDFRVAEVDGHVAGTGGVRFGADQRAEVLRVRVHPAARRRGVGRALMTALERAALRHGMREAHLDTATNQPEAMAFYTALGYAEVGREHRPEWSWTLVYYAKNLRECAGGGPERMAEAAGREARALPVVHRAVPDHGAQRGGPGR